MEVISGILKEVRAELKVMQEGIVSSMTIRIDDTAFKELFATIASAKQKLNQASYLTDFASAQLPIGATLGTASGACVEARREAYNTGVENTRCYVERGLGAGAKRGS